jgi:hypothetical protein
MLDEVDAQHALQTNGWAAIASFGVARLNDLAQCGPRHYGLHRLQKLIAPGGLAVVFKGLVCSHCEGLLFHGHHFEVMNVTTQVTSEFGT